MTPPPFPEFCRRVAVLEAHQAARRRWDRCQRYDRLGTYAYVAAIALGLAYTAWLALKLARAATPVISRTASIDWTRARRPGVYARSSMQRYGSRVSTVGW